MDFSFLSNLFGGANTAPGAGSPPAAPQGGYYFGDRPAPRSDMADGGVIPAPGPGVSAPVSGAAASPMPAGAPAASAAGGANGIPHQNSMGAGGSIGGELSNSFKAIGDMIANYKMAGAAGQQEVAAQVPNFRVEPVLATFPLPSIR